MCCDGGGVCTGVCSCAIGVCVGDGDDIVTSRRPDGADAEDCPNLAIAEALRLADRFSDPILPVLRLNMETLRIDGVLGRGLNSRSVRDSF